MTGLNKRSLNGIRMYLWQQGVELPTTADEEQICGSLYRFLVEHRADASLWRGLTLSIQDTGCRSIRLVPKAGTAASFCSVAADMARLRAALPSAPGINRSGYDIFRKGLSTGVLSIFLSVGAGFTMTGCPDSEESVDVTEDAGTSDEETDTISDATPIDTESESDLVDTESESDLIDTGVDESGACTAGDGLQDAVIAAGNTPAEKAGLCDCFSDLSDGWVAGLTETFASGTTAEIAAVLDQMVICCDYYDLANDGIAFGNDTADGLKAGTLCQESIAIYLAVPFKD